LRKSPSVTFGLWSGWLPNGTCSGRIVTDVVVDFFEAKRRLRLQEKAWEPPPVQKTLALAEEFRRQLAAGGVNQSSLAHLYGLTRARVTQVLNLLKLHPAVRDFLGGMPAGPHARLYTERRVRPLVALEPAAQLDEAGALLRGFVPPEKGRHSA
jgi:hypothetical protein